MDPFHIIILLLLALILVAVFSVVRAFVLWHARRKRERAWFKREVAWYQRQIAEDTCSTHCVFCCPICFDMSTSGVGWPE